MNRKERFEEILKEYEQMMFRVCRIYAHGEVEEMQDLYQDILINVWKSLAVFENKSSEGTWIYRVVLNTAISYSRMRRRKMSFVAIRHEENSIMDEYKPDSMVESLYEAIEELDNEMDKTMVFLFLDNKTYAEIAEILGISVSNVGTRIQRVKLKLKRIVDDKL